MKNILVIGFSTRNIICSGNRAGYNMYAIDAFCDHDMLECARAAIKLDIGEGFHAGNIKISDLCEMIDSFGIEFDAIIPASGFETINFPKNYPIRCNDQEIMKEVTDKSRFARLLSSLNLPHPQTYSLSEIGNIKSPIMVKPACSGGGILNRVLYDPGDLHSYLDSLNRMHIQLTEKDLVFQDYLQGIPASVSVVSTEDRASAVAINEQLIGIPWLTGLPFAYCGNITPLYTPFSDQMKNIAENLILELGLVGSSGVDFLITENGPVIIEVNARFQGSLDTVELSTGLNLFEAHMQAFEGKLPDEPLNREYAARAIIYGDRNIEVSAHLHEKILENRSVDVPNTGDRVGPDEPLTSVLSTGNCREEVIREARSSVMFIRECLDLDSPQENVPRTESTYVQNIK